MVATKVTDWIKKNKVEAAIILLVLLLAAFFRFYRLSEYMTFLGDEGRDAIVIKKILTEGDIPFIGPPTSIGNMYLGPLYYYMMAVPMAIFWLNPIAAAGQVALIGVLTVGLIYYLCRQWFGMWPAAISSLLYVVSPVTIIYSRSSWNPNPTPFFALLSILGLYKANQTKNYLWFILTGISLAFAVQMHYLALILIPISGFLWLYELIYNKKRKIETENFLLGTVLAAVSFLILMSPLVLFDLKHNFMNYRAVKEFFSNRETTVNVNPFNTVGRIYPIYSYNLIGRYLAAQNVILGIITSILVLLPIVWSLRKLNWQYLVLLVWLVGALLGLALYKQNVYDHYLGFVNPAPFILLGAVMTVLNRKLLALFIVFVLSLIFINFQNTPVKNPPNKQLERTQEVARFVIDKAENKPFNFALLAKSNYDSAYQYYLDLYGHKPKQVPFDITDQLFVVCEDSVCEPINHPKYEIAGFGWGKIETEQNFSGVRVYKIVHNPSGQ